jgi:hypothetical protein
VESQQTEHFPVQILAVDATFITDDGRPTFHFHFAQDNACALACQHFFNRHSGSFLKIDKYVLAPPSRKCAAKVRKPPDRP